MFPCRITKVTCCITSRKNLNNVQPSVKNIRMIGPLVASKIPLSNPNYKSKQSIINAIQTPTVFACWELHLINIDLLGST